MSTTEEKKNLRTSPTEKMVAAAKKAAERHGVKAPAKLEQDFDTCKAFLDKYLNLPTEKQLGFAKKISSEKGVPIPDEVLANSRDLSAWIDSQTKS